MQLSFEKVYPNMHDLWDKKVGAFLQWPKNWGSEGFLGKKWLNSYQMELVEYIHATIRETPNYPYVA